MSVFISVSSRRHLRSGTLCLKCASDQSHTVNTLRMDDEMKFLKLVVILFP